MRVCQNLTVVSCEWTIHFSRSRCDDLVCWVAGKRLRQLSRCYGDSRVQGQQADSCISQGSIKPLPHRQRQHQAPFLDQFGNFPATDDTHTDTIRLARREICAFSVESSGLPLTHQIQMWVSRTIMSSLPSLSQRRVPAVAHISTQIP
jgi:hypothetical protein